MFTKKLIGTALACMLTLGAWSGSALATPQNVGGVWIDPSSPLDLNIQALNFRESSVAAVGDILYGYGQIGSVNGTNAGTFCPGCDLNFTIQYTVKDIGGTPTNPLVVFDSGTINFYVAPAGSFNVLDPGTAGIGSLWLSLAGHAAPRTGFETLLEGELYSVLNGTVSNPMQGSGGWGWADVTGGAAAWFTDTNSIDDGNGGWADFSIDSSFQFQDAGICGTNSICYPITGTGALIGKSAVPEPGAAGLLGIGLAILGLLMRRRSKEAEGRV